VPAHVVFPVGALVAMRGSVPWGVACRLLDPPPLRFNAGVTAGALPVAPGGARQTIGESEALPAYSHWPTAPTSRESESGKAMRRSAANGRFLVASSSVRRVRATLAFRRAVAVSRRDVGHVAAFRACQTSRLMFRYAESLRPGTVL